MMKRFLSMGIKSIRNCYTGQGRQSLNNDEGNWSIVYILHVLVHKVCSELNEMVRETKMVWLIGQRRLWLNGMFRSSRYIGTWSMFCQYILAWAILDAESNE